MIIEIAGWLGAGAVLVAFYWINLGKASHNSTLYQLLNLVGSLLLVFNTVYLKAYPSAFVNAIWFVIAVLGLIKRT